MKFIINNNKLEKCINEEAVLDIPFGVVEIEDEAFYNLKKIKQINIPSSVKRIGRKSFSCTSFKSIVLPRSVNYIDNRAFDCSNVEKVYILNPQVLIDLETFDHCYELSDIYFAGSETDWANAMLDEEEGLLLSSDVTIHFDYKIGYQELIDGLNNRTILKLEFGLDNYAHYSNCEINCNSECINLELTSDGSESLQCYGKFSENIKMFDIKGKGKFTFKDIYNHLIIKNITFK